MNFKWLIKLREYSVILYQNMTTKTKTCPKKLETNLELNLIDKNISRQRSYVGQTLMKDIPEEILTQNLFKN